MEYDLVVIGSGPGGYIAAIKGAQQGWKVAIVEKKHLGGICLNWGCIPTKALLKSAEVYNDLKNAKNYGLKAESVDFDYPAIVKRSRKVADQNSRGVKFLLKKNKIDVVEGIGRVLAKGSVEVEKSDGQKELLSCKNIILATGASPRELPDYPIDGKIFMSYHQMLASRDFPKRMLVIGSGAIGTEFGWFLHSLGTEVHLVEMLPQILPVEDEEIAKALQGSFKKQGLKTYVSTKVVKIEVLGKTVRAQLQPEKGDTIKLEADRVLVAVGMVPNTSGLGLAQAGVELDERTFVRVDHNMQTSVLGIFAIGDMTGRQMLAHKASAEAEAAIAFMEGKENPVDYGLIPGCTYCQPQVASVGLTEKACKEKGLEISIGRFPFGASGKARAIGHTDGLVKLIFGKKHGELLGAHILGSEATELLAELGLAMKLESTWEEIAGSIHAHPTLSEAVMESALDSRGLSPHL